MISHFSYWLYVPIFVHSAYSQYLYRFIPLIIRICTVSYAHYVSISLRHSSLCICISHNTQWRSCKLFFRFLSRHFVKTIRKHDIFCIFSVLSVHNPQTSLNIFLNCGEIDELALAAGSRWRHDCVIVDSSETLLSHWYHFGITDTAESIKNKFTIPLFPLKENQAKEQR